ncbi:MAG: hypothetical protein IJ207_13475 [Treponema sp.]|uniref:hypothetical protein n=1 Tax=Treponema sp. TaxID=166 RepID=UPI0025F677DA|nr:hypothetical protein [Treponema sp.]MBQ9283184.1 hypothetical protein [Treponema sp.]
MKKSLPVTVFFLIIAAAVLVSCSGVTASDSAASLLVSLPVPHSRTASWVTEIDSYSVTVKGSGAESYSQTQKVGQNASVAFYNLPAGNCSVSVLAQNQNGEEIAKGSGETLIQEEKTASVTIRLSYIGTEDEDIDAVEEDIDENSITYGGTVSLNGLEYKTLSAALIAANESSSANKIVFNGNIKENLLATSGDSNLSINVNTTIDLNGYVLSWAEFDESAMGDYDAEEIPLFEINASNVTLLITNGTIISPDGVVHNANLVSTGSSLTGSNIVLSKLKILNIHSSYSLIAMDASGGGLYMDTVTMKNSSCSRESTGAIYVTEARFSALNTCLENVLGDTASVYLYGLTDGAFVGGSIILSSDESLSAATATESRDNAIYIARSSNFSSSASAPFAVSSSVIYSNTAAHGYPVAITDSEAFNLSDGVKFYRFNEDSFEVEQITKTKSDGSTEEYVTISDIDSSLSASANILAAAQSSELTKSLDSEETAISLGYSSAMYISGNSEIYGTVEMNYNSVLNCASAIAQTGEITSDVVTKVDFGEVSNISYYTNARNNAPFYWAGGSESSDDMQNSFDLSKFQIYDPDGDFSSYLISATSRTVTDAGESSGNTIYAPIEQ